VDKRTKSVELYKTDMHAAKGFGSVAFDRADPRRRMESRLVHLNRLRQVVHAKR